MNHFMERPSYKSISLINKIVFFTHFTLTNDEHHHILLPFSGHMPVEHDRKKKWKAVLERKDKNIM